MRYEVFAKSLAEEYLQKGIISGEDLPDMELYLDQVVTLMNRELELFCTEKEPAITKATVTNYVKHKMIPAPEKKKYSKQHLEFLAMAYYMKGSLSMDQVSDLMKPVLKNLSSDWDEQMDMDGIFNKIMDQFRQEQEALPQAIDSRIAEIKKYLSSTGVGEDDTAELIMLIISLVLRSNAERFIAEKLLKEYFQ